MPSSPRSQTTRLLHSLDEGDPQAAEQLLPLVYQELHRRARQMMGDRAGHTLQPTALIHEAYLRLVDQDGVRPESRLHFVNIAARAMRFVLADHAKARGAGKRGGGQRPVTLNEGAVGELPQSEDILALEESLTRLTQVDEQLCRIVELRFYGGLENKEVAEALGVSLRTVERGWRVARAWLANDMEAGA